MLESAEIIGSFPNIPPATPPSTTKIIAITVNPLFILRRSAGLKLISQLRGRCAARRLSRKFPHLVQNAGLGLIMYQRRNELELAL